MVAHTSVIPTFYPGDEEAETGESPQPDTNLALSTQINFLFPQVVL